VGLLRAERAVPYACYYGILAYVQQISGFPYGDTPRTTPSTTPFDHSTLSLVRRIVRLQSSDSLPPGHESLVGKMFEEYIVRDAGGSPPDH
jgi:hypothetical protein